MQVTCGLCERHAHGASLRFEGSHHWMGGPNLKGSRNLEGVECRLDIELCDRCAERMEKHLKRAIPKRLMEFAPLVEAHA